MTTPHAVMFREGEHGWWVCGVPEYRISELLARGWRLVVCDAQIRAQDIEDTYQADLRGLKERR